METLRRRVPFKVADEDEFETVLDEQEQEEVINDLREQAASSNAQYRLLLQVLLGISTLLQLIYLFDPTKDSPLLSVFPVHGPQPLPIPLSTVLTLLSLAIHMHIFLLARYQAQYLKNNLGITNSKGLVLDITYALSGVAPALSMFLRKPWQITVWWFVTPLIVYLAQTVLEAIEDGNNSVAELEAKKYRAPGA